MKQSYFMGIDISKSKIDIALVDENLQLIQEKEVINTDQKLKVFLTTVLKKLKIKPAELLICCETTGIYNRPLERVCEQLQISLWVEHALKIKRASTDMRGKNDKQDALRIAEYAVRYQDRQVLYQEPTKEVKELNGLIKVRETLLAQKVALENQLREAKTHDPEQYKLLEAGFRGILKKLTSSIKGAEEKIEDLTQKEKSISTNLELMKSIPGIGQISALQFIVATNNFKNFESAKHLACYAGVVPFQNKSGTIIKRERISKMANQKIKMLLHLAAMSACRSDLELKAYFIRKVKEGKNKMSVLNAIRNKLVHRIMAVVTRQTPYIRHAVLIKPNVPTILVAN